MLSRILLLPVAVATFALADAANPVLYRENFALDGQIAGSDRIRNDMLNSGWVVTSGRFGELGDIIDFSKSPFGSKPGINNGANMGDTQDEFGLFWSPSDTNTRLIMYTQEYQALDISDINAFRFDTRKRTDTPDSQPEIRALVEIGGEVYVSNEFVAFPPEPRNSFGPTGNGWFVMTIEFSGLTWATNPVDLSTPPIGMVNNDFTPATLPSSGQVTSFGLYSNKVLTNHYVDNFEVLGVPEPSALTLVAFGGVVLLAIRRRR